MAQDKSVPGAPINIAGLRRMREAGEKIACLTWLKTAPGLT